MDIKCERDEITTNLTELTKKMVREYTKLDNRWKLYINICTHIY